MLNDDYYAAALINNPGGPGPDKPVTKVTPELRSDWNNFIDYLDKKGVKGNPSLDDKDKAMGKQYLNEYLKANPNSKLSYDVVPAIQQDFQDIRANGLKDIRAGKVKIDGLKSEDEFMQNLSPVDGWLGSMTTSHKFPTAVSTNKNTGERKDFGTNLDAYEALVKPYRKP